MSHVAELLRQGVAGLGLSLPAGAFVQLSDYLALLMKWNRVYNLTAIRDEGMLVTHHLLDSLAVVPYVPPGSLVDVGSGAGLPGIPVAIACPERTIAVLDSNQKKSAFLTQVVAELGLHNTRVINQRAQDYRPGDGFDIVVSRAFSDLGNFANDAGHLCKAGGVLIGMKGIQPSAEIAELPPSWQVDRIVALTVPRLEAARHLVFMRATH